MQINNIDIELKNKNPMTTIINYHQTFDKTTVKRGLPVICHIQVNFWAPLMPDVNVWIDNIADNLGGSKASSGPFHSTYLNYFTTTNLIATPDNDKHFTAVGQPDADGCLRFWTGSSNYPSGTQRWRPINWNQQCSIDVNVFLDVRSDANFGEAVTAAPTFVSPPSNTNYESNKIMMEFGSSMVLNIVSGQSLTIVP
jgi:hypothetical protein